MPMCIPPIMDAGLPFRAVAAGAGRHRAHARIGVEDVLSGADQDLIGLLVGLDGLYAIETRRIGGLLVRKIAGDLGHHIRLPRARPVSPNLPIEIDRILPGQLGILRVGAVAIRAMTGCTFGVGNLLARARIAAWPAIGQRRLSHDR